MFPMGFIQGGLQIEDPRCSERPLDSWLPNQVELKYRAYSRWTGKFVPSSLTVEVSIRDDCIQSAVIELSLQCRLLQDDRSPQKRPGFFECLSYLESPGIYLNVAPWFENIPVRDEIYDLTLRVQVANKGSHREYIRMRTDPTKPMKPLGKNNNARKRQTIGYLKVCNSAWLPAFLATV